MLGMVVCVLWGGDSFGMLPFRRPTYCFSALASVAKRLPVLPESTVFDGDDSSEGPDEEELVKLWAPACAEVGPDAEGNFRSLSDVYAYLRKNSFYRGEGEVVRDGFRFRFRVFDSLGGVCVSVGS